MKTILSVMAAVCLTGCWLDTEPCHPGVSYPEPGTCPNGSLGEGNAGGPCVSGVHWGPACDEGLTCIQETCLPCGGEGSLCCAGTDDADGCNGTMGCKQETDEYGYCLDDCGELGEACCSDDGDGCLAGTCGDSYTCVETASSGCEGSGTYAVWVTHTATQCVSDQPIAVNGDTAGDAVACLQGGLESGLEAGHADEVPTGYYLCPIGLNTGTNYGPIGPFYNFSAEAAIQCLATLDFPPSDYTIQECASP